MATELRNVTSTLTVDKTTVCSAYQYQVMDGVTVSTYPAVPISVPCNSTNASTSPSTSQTTPGSHASIKPRTTPAPVSNQDGISGGAVAGTAIGCLLAGALIAVLVCLFLYRRQKNRRPEGHGSTRLPYRSENKTRPPMPVAMTATPVPNRVGRDLDNLLPQPVDDGTIAKELSRIRNNIKNHAQAYYHSQSVHADIDRSTMDRFATATRMSVTFLDGMFHDISTRGDGIRLFIAWSILSRYQGGAQHSLLPHGLGPLLATISEKGGTDPSESSSYKKPVYVRRSLVANHVIEVKSVLFSKWKVLTGTLLEQKDGGRAHAANMPIHASARIIDEMDLVLKHFVQGGIDTEKRRLNLEMILSRAAKLAFLLFSQPGSFHFDFSGSLRRRLVVFPALVQVVGDQAEAFSPPRILLHTEFAGDAGA